MAIPIGAGGGQLTTPPPSQQDLRTCTLLVSNTQGQAIDLSALRIKFSVKRSNNQTPNVADIRVYNLSNEYALALKAFTRVRLQAGYEGNFGVIFSGTIRQVLIGRESATDTYVEIIAGDGHVAYNYAIVNTSLAAGTNQQDQVNACIASMELLGVSAGGNATVPNTQSLPRGKVLFGCARDMIRRVAQTTQSSWSIQNEQINFVAAHQYLPGAPIVLTPQTGLVGSPQQTLQGVNCKCLLNPFIRVSTRIQLQNSAIQRLPVNLEIKGTQASIPVALKASGIYYVAIVEHLGDTRGIEWYSNLITITINPSTLGGDPVPVNYEQ